MNPSSFNPVNFLVSLAFGWFVLVFFIGGNIAWRLARAR